MQRLAPGCERARATIVLAATPAASAIAVEASVVVVDTALRADAQLFVAYADGGLHSDVRAGENRGVRLSHERVVRALRLAATPDAQGRLHARLEIPKPREAGTGPLLVAFVQRRSNGDVLQTMTLPLDGCTAN